LAAEPLVLEWNGEVTECELTHPEKVDRTLHLECELPLGMLPGNAFPEPLRFRCGPGRVRVGNWQEVGLPTYAGGLTYRQSFTLDSVPDPLWLDLGRVRGTVEVALNGVECGIRPWSPYRFVLTAAAVAGNNELEMTLFNTLGPFFGEGHPAIFGYPSQWASGVVGPIRLKTS
jgi:hypothetical protein